jgi:hypothetical protein
MRLGEAVGLALTDLHLSNDIPHINITSHPGRRLKTRGNERCVPLVGEARWAASRAFNGASESSFLFPRYNRASSNKAKSARRMCNSFIHSDIQ